MLPMTRHGEVGLRGYFCSSLSLSHSVSSSLSGILRRSWLYEGKSFVAEEPKLIIVGGPRSIFMDHLRNQIIMSIGEQDNTNAERFRYSIHEQPITWEDWHE